MPSSVLQPASPNTSPVSANIAGGFGSSQCSVVVVGVAETEQGWGFRLHDLLLPARIAGGLDRLQFSNPLELLSRLGSATGSGYPLAVVTLNEGAAMTPNIQRHAAGCSAPNTAATR